DTIVPVFWANLVKRTILSMVGGSPHSYIAEPHVWRSRNTVLCCAEMPSLMISPIARVALCVEALWPVRPFLGSRFPFDQSSQHQLAGHSEYVRGHVCSLDVGGFQYSQQTVPLRRLTLHQFTPIAHQVAEFANGLRRNEAGTE